jgi:hypothetical protein
LLAQANQRLLADGQAVGAAAPYRNGSAAAPEWETRRWWQRLLWG